MLETHAIIVQELGENALVEVRQGGGCGHCNSENGCSSGKLSQLFCNNPRRFKVSNPSGAKMGQEVAVTLHDGVLLRSSAIIYVVPLSLMLSGSILAAHWASSAASRDLYAVLGALLGLLSGFVVAKWLAIRHRLSAEARPVEANNN